MNTLTIRITPDSRISKPVYSGDLVTIHDDPKNAIIDICEGLEQYAHEHRAELLEAILWAPPRDLLGIMRDVLRIVSSVEEEAPIAESDEEFAHRMRTTGSHDGEARKWGGQQLARIIRNDPERNPIAMNVAGTSVRYLGKIDSIESKIGTLTGKRWIPEDLGIECVGIEIDGIEWGIPSAVPLELIDDLGDQHAVHDAPEVDAEAREPMTKYRAEQSDEFPGVDWFSQKPCQITFEQLAAKTINDGWRYSQYWSQAEWPRQALRDCDKRIAGVEKDLAALKDIRVGLVEINAEMDERVKEDAEGAVE